MKPVDPKRLLPYETDWVRRYVLAELLGKPPALRPRPGPPIRNPKRPSIEAEKKRF